MPQQPVKSQPKKKVKEESEDDEAIEEPRTKKDKSKVNLKKR